MMEENNILDFDMPKHRSSVIKVIGVGGGGSNAVNYMKSQGIRGVDFIICNTDVQALEFSTVENKVQLGVNLTEGLGAGANPEVGEKAAIESYSAIQSVLGASTKMVFITAGMGGGTGTGAAPIIAKAAQEMGILTIGIVTAPFHFEGGLRLRQAEVGIEKLKDHVDSIIVINNNKLREVYGNLGFKTGFNKADEVLATAAKGIAEVITHHYNVNIDLRDARTVLKDSGTAIMGSSKAKGSNRAINAVQGALDSPLLNDNHIQGALHVLLLIVSGNREHEITFDEIGEINDYIQSQAGKQVDIIMGIGEDEKLEDAVQVTIIATGFNASNPVGLIKPIEQEVIIHDLDGSPHNSNTSINIENDTISKEDRSTQFNLFSSGESEYNSEVESVLNNQEVLKNEVSENPINGELSKNEVDEEHIVHHLDENEDKIEVRFDNNEPPIEVDSESKDIIDKEVQLNNDENDHTLSSIASFDLSEDNLNFDYLVDDTVFDKPLVAQESTPRVFDAFSMDAPEDEQIPEINQVEDDDVENKVNYDLNNQIKEDIETNEQTISNTGDSHFLDEEKNKSRINGQIKKDALSQDEPEKKRRIIDEFSLEDLRALENELDESREKVDSNLISRQIIKKDKKIDSDNVPEEESNKYNTSENIQESEKHEDNEDQNLNKKNNNEDSSDISLTIRSVEPLDDSSLFPVDPDQDSINESMQRIANQRRAYLQNFNHQFGKNIKLVAVNEEEWQTPSFERNGLDLPEGKAPYSQEKKKSNLGLSGQDEDIEFLSHNSFLHDNVD